MDVLVATEAGVDRTAEHPGHDGRAVVRASPRAVELGGARPRRPLEGLEDGRLGDPVATLEVRRLGVERGDRRQGVGQVVEHEHQVGFDEGGDRDGDRIAIRERHARFERGDRVVGESADRAAGETRHALGRLDPAARHERADRVERIRGRVGLDRQIRGERGNRDRPGLDPGEPIAHLEQAARADAQERVAPEPLPALDRFQEVGGPAVVEAEEGPDRRLEVGRARGAQKDRVGVRGQAPGLRQADRIGCGHRVGLGESRTTNRLRDERSCLPRCHPHSACAALVTDGLGSVDPLPPIGAARYRWRSAPEPTGACSSRRLAFGPEAPGSIPCRRRSGSHQPPDLWVDVRRVLVPFTARSS